MKKLGNKVIFSVFILCSILFGRNQCNGVIDKKIDGGIYIQLKMKSIEKCWVNIDMSPYYIKRKEDSIFIKIAPPTNKIESDFFYKERISGRKKVRYRLLNQRDTLLFEWIGLKSDTEKIDDKTNMPRSFYFLKGSTYEPFTYVKKGEHLILDIPCLDEETAKRAPPFHITKTRYPFLRCIIAPAQRDYFGE